MRRPPATSRRIIRQRPDAAFALIVTLIMVALAAVIVVALLVNASLERTTATSYAYRSQAELAVQSGLEAAKKALTTDGAGNRITHNDHFTVVRATPAPAPAGVADYDTPHYYFVGNASQGPPGQITYYPLFSGGAAQTISVSAAPIAPAAPLPNVPPDPAVAPNFPTLLAAVTPHPSPLPAVTTTWVRLESESLGAGAAPAPTTYVRYCFWIEDLGGYLDAGIVGNNRGSAGEHVRGEAEPVLDGLPAPARTALWTLFSRTSSTDTATEDADIINNRPLFRTSESVRPAVPSASALVLQQNVAAGLRPDLEQTVIPFGVLTKVSPDATYASAGQLKTDLNANLNAGGVNVMASAIQTNLPQWATLRRGGFGGVAANPASDDGYRKSIAANIVDYADVESDATVGTNYRGVDSYPLVTEFYDHVNWTAVSAASITILITSYIEIWNMTNKATSGTVEFKDYYRHRLDLGAYTYFGDDHDPENPSAGESVSGIPYPSQQVSLESNEFKVLKFGPATYTLQTGGSIPASPIELKFTKTGRYELRWKSDGGSALQIVDAPLGGVTMAEVELHNPPSGSNRSFSWSGTLPGFGYGTIAFYNPGDPRSSFYIAASQAANSYQSNASMWSRNQKPTSTNPVGKEVKPSRWPDGGHETPLGTAGSNVTVHPSTARPANAPAIQPSKAPAQISNSGQFVSVTELGHIFDPAQWKISTTGDRWSDIDGTTPADQKYGGGFTLRIGRPEFTRFDQPGARSSQLLDIFTAGARRETRGLVNLNTAPREVLRALAAGILLKRDPDIAPAELNSSFYAPRVSDEADKFADAVIATRNTAPLVSTSQLAHVREPSGAAFFGNTAQWTAPQTPPTEWNDRGTEELFARIFDLTAVRSRNFRVFVTGQSVDPRQTDAAGNPKVLSTVRKVFQVFLNPTRDAAGKIDAQKVDVTYEREL